MARPTIYDWPTIIDEVCAWLASGQTIRAYCRQQGKPTDVALYQHVALSEELGLRIARARSLGADRIAEEALAIADTPQVGETVTVDKDGEKVTREDMLGHRKLQVDTRMRLLAKWNSGRYGDKSHVEHSGTISDGLTEEQRTQRIAEILRTAKVRKGSNTQSGDVDGGAAKLSRNPKP